VEASIYAYWGTGETINAKHGIAYINTNKTITAFGSNAVDDTNIEDGYCVDGWVVVAIDADGTDTFIKQLVVDFNETIDLSQFVSKMTPDKYGVYDLELYFVPNVVETVSVDDVTLASEITATAGSTPNVNLTYDGETLTEGSDFTVTYYSDAACTVAVDDITKVSAGTYYAKITGTG